MTTSNPASNEPHPDPVALTSNPDPSKNSKTGVDYEPHPSSSIPVSPERQEIVNALTRLYSGSASEEDMQVCSSFSSFVGYEEKGITEERELEKRWADHKMGVGVC